jgi:hypothetical protein
MRLLWCGVQTVIGAVSAGVAAADDRSPGVA